MKFQALEPGFFEGRRVEPGEILDLPKGMKPGKWMGKVGTAKPATPEPDEGPRTLSEMTKIDLARDAKASGLQQE